MKKLIMLAVFTLGLGLASNASAVCVDRACDLPGGGEGAQTVCCSDGTNPDNVGEPSAEVVTCGSIEVESAIVAGCIGSDAGSNNIAGCTGVRGALTTSDVVPDSDSCEEEAVAACEACGCAVPTTPCEAR